ncbi:MAG TPA: thiamine phosphate synthase [Crocinitomix sp.]|nr:thiamine phosphate synthase [Crocinitomix sp.]
MKKSPHYISKIQYITQSKTEYSILEEVEQVLQAGIDWIQLRVKNENIDFLSVARKVKTLTKKYNATLIINDNIEIVQKVNAQGVHLGLTDTPIIEARTILGQHKIIGGTANTLADAKNVELFGANYIGLGPFRDTKTKQNLSPILGLKGYQNIIPKIKPYGWNILSFNIPIIAIGGLRIEDINQLVNQTGIYGVALSSLIYNASNKSEIVTILKQMLSENQKINE